MGLRCQHRLQGSLQTKQYSPHAAFLKGVVPELTGMARTARLPLHAILRWKARAGSQCVSSTWKLCVEEGIVRRSNLQVTT